MLRRHPRSDALTVEGVERRVGRTQLVVSGDLDLGTVDRLRRALAAVPESDAVLLDLGGVVFVDCSAMRLLEEAAAGRGRRLTVVPASPHVQRVLRIAGVERKLNFARSSLGAAVADARTTA